MSLIDDYFRIEKEYIAKYGVKTFVLLQKGDFYESYGYDDNLVSMRTVSDLLNIQLTRSNKKLDISKGNPYMMGVPIHKLNKYVRMLVDNNYVVVQVDQIQENDKIRREVSNVYTVANYIEGSQAPDYNNIVSIYIDKEDAKNKSLYCVGLASIDLTTGASNIYEIINNDQKYTYDYILKYMDIYYPKEVLLVGNFNDEEKDTIIKTLELQNKKMYHYKLNPTFTKKSYQNQFFQKIFPKSGLLSPIENLELERNEYATISYVYLLDYTYQCRPQILKNLKAPEHNDLFNKQKYMTLGNDSVVQLNLVNGNQSLFDIINNTTTLIGRRYLKKNLLNPLINETLIMERYNGIEEIMKNNLMDKLDDIFKNMCDLERYKRKLETLILNPCDFHSIVMTIDNVIKLELLLNQYIHIGKFRLDKNYDKLLEMKKYYDNLLDVQYMNVNLNDSITQSFFKKGKIKEIDDIINEINECNNFMETLGKELAKFLPEKKDYFDGTCVIKVVSTEKEYYLETTKKRAETIQKGLEKMCDTIDTNKMTALKIGKYVIKPSEIQYDISSRSSIAKIRTKYLSENSDRLLELEEQLSCKIKEHYKKFLLYIYDKYDDLLEHVVSMVGIIDFLNSGAKIAKLYNYTKPILEQNHKSFVSVKQMRHPIIERINTKTKYIPHDLALSDSTNDSQDGILLYGLNSAGKTTIVRSLGLCVIMAQLGYFVPATSMRYKPYHHIFTRISGSDNLYKNLSSFGVEMNELDSIMRRSGKNSLVLSDELCRGTETDSAMIIVLGMIEKLLKTNTNFISATHLHELANMKRIKEKKNIGIYHIHIEYDNLNDKLIYVRELRKGPGLNFYGLLVARCMIMDNEFLAFTDEIKKEIIGEQSVLRNKKSNYNSSIYMDKCQICGHKPKPTEKPLETHHIKEQVNADENNMIEGYNKNDMSNLAVLCNECHDMTEKYINGIYINITGFIETSLGRELKYEIIYK
jgi:DNA mismatch repair protein MutS